ncbi:Low-density lipoprotein receptor-related protein 2 [Lamellibrachia satsuma]|nr:Low-density lipoprotein receptor-related protein 2 [Lamellibrachia satsuma]
MVIFLSCSRPLTCRSRRRDMKLLGVLCVVISLAGSGTAYNPVDMRVYWTDVRDDIAKRSYLNGTKEEVIALLHGGSIPGGIAVDFVSGLVYYTDGASDSIAVMSLDGRQHFTLLTGDMDEPRDIVLDIARGTMYWSDRGKDPRIRAAEMDGTNRETIIKFAPPSWPIGLAIDHREARLYWCNALTETIGSSTLNGGDTKIVMHLPGSHIFGIALLGMNLYYTDWRNSYVSKINISHSMPAPQQVGRAVFSNPSGIAAYSIKEYTHDKCPQEYTAQKGRIRSPGYPGYRNNVHCVIIVRMNNTRGHERRLRLDVDEFNLEIKYDYLVIGSTKKAGSELTAGHSYTVSTRDEDFRWLFVTDGSIVDNGFSFRYEILYCNSSKPCMNGGTCVNGEICKCPSGYDGNYCGDVETSSCRSSPCRNGGQCQVETTGYKCICPIGTSGDNCETDLTAAFDTIDHTILLRRLRGSGLCGDVHAWLTSYLHNRTNVVRVKSSLSEVNNITTVPQGSVLGPILFNAYIAPLAKLLNQHNMQHHL